MMGEELYCQYVGKNVLNFFCQDNGYKVGIYVKIWDGCEDNVYFVEVLDSLDMNVLNYVDLVYKGFVD